MRSLILLLTLVSCDSSTSTPDGGTVPNLPAARSSTLLDQGWVFFGSNTLSGAEAPAFDDTGWASVTVPHTWNPKQMPMVLYTHAWYRLHFPFDAAQKGRRVYVSFEGVGTIADVFVNGHPLGQHRGAYTRFTFDATDAVTVGDNVLAVKVDNDDADTADCLPATPYDRDLYEPYGGIYRKAWLVTTDPVHVDPTDFGSSGVYLTPTVDAAGNATLSAKTMIRNVGGVARSVHVAHHVLDASGDEVATLTSDVSGDPAVSQATGPVPNVHLWGHLDPYLYTVKTELSVDGVVRDTVTERIGFRTFVMKPDGFFVNGQLTLLRGVAKHQETEIHQAAVTDAELTADWDALQELGVNYIRMAHYPHAKLEYDLADQRGIVVWAENGYSTPAPWTPNADRLTREMVRQTYNHPSIAFYSAGNESAPDAPSQDSAVRFGQAIREEDATRLVTYASNNGFSSTTFDFTSHNLYEGLFGGQPWAFEADAMSLHWVSENGGRSVVTQHADFADAIRVPYTFEPEECIQPIAEASAEIVFRTSGTQIPLYTWWAFRDFQLRGWVDGVDDNGMLTYDGLHRKDHFYLWQSFLRPELPVVHLVGKAYYVRRGSPTNGIKAYSNAASLRLSLNGVDQGSRANGAYTAPNSRVVENTFLWEVPLYQGENVAVIDDGQGHTDEATIVFAGAGGLAATPPKVSLVANVTSSNGSNPAYFLDRSIEPDVAVYYDFDASADNSFADIPASIAGARWIATKRLSKPENLTDLTVTLGTWSPKIDVLVMLTDDGSPTTFVTNAGFTDAGITGAWRDAGMNRVPFRVFVKHAASGDVVTVPGATRDYAILVRPGV